MSDNRQQESDHNSKTQIILGLLTFMGVLIGGIFTNWDKIFHSVNPTTQPLAPASPIETVNPLKTENLEVYANSVKGISFTNGEDKYVKVRFKADPTDRWIAIPEYISDPDIPEHAKGYLPPRGDLEFRPGETSCPVPLGALIVVGGNRGCKASGEESDFQLAPEETIYFLMNDVIGLYGDNKGSVSVEVSIFRE